MAHKKAGGSTSYGRDSQGQRLGIKLFAGEMAQPGSILVRQRGTHIHPGLNVLRGKDDTLFAIERGLVRFRTLKRRRFDGRILRTRYIDIVSSSS